VIGTAATLPAQPNTITTSNLPIIFDILITPPPLSSKKEVTTN
jgi:hypothetical protein